ncbi:DUF3987 domain-containing protein [Streptomyces graminilatus]|uniref:DUF3987 domain-containing protein n=1 Tax=Streptomyces graminilatus TaxID=1464070 RepID=UPI000B03A37F|nr:DUF3987 domain-containing protein [Streptomyces graminilatus]
MTTFEAMKYGPLGEAVEAVMPSSEADPIGVWAACLSLYSSAISRKVRLDNGRPVVVWTVLAGRSAIGRKGYALNTARGILRPVIGGYMEARIRDGVSSGPSLVDMLAKLELETMGSELGIDGRAMLVEEEWASVLKTQKRCSKFSTLFRTAWDGKPISNRTKKEGLQSVQRPLLGFHSHITPGEWAKYVSSSEALGGSYNRLLPVLVQGSKMLPYDHKPTFPDVAPLAAAFKWAAEEERVMSFDKPAGRRFDELRAYIEQRMAEMPELLSSYMERAAEQVQRIAAVLAASEKKTKISRRAVEAAWAFVQKSMASVEQLVRDAADQGARPMKTTEELVREILTRYGGEASSTTLLRALGTRANAAALKEAVADMDDVEVYKLQQPGRGAKPIMYRLTEGVETEVPESTETESKAPHSGKPVLRVVVGQDSKPPKKPRKVREVAAVAPPAAPTNPILALL